MEQAGGGEAGGGGGEAAASAEGKQIFTQSCGTCHTLSDAGTNGNVGPDLDQLKPDKARVESAIENGGAGSGAMPADIVTGAEAEAVATYVVLGRRQVAAGSRRIGSPHAQPAGRRPRW